MIEIRPAEPDGVVSGRARGTLTLTREEYDTVVAPAVADRLVALEVRPFAHGALDGAPARAGSHTGRENGEARS